MQLRFPFWLLTLTTTNCSLCFLYHGISLRKRFYFSRIARASNSDDSGDREHFMNKRAKASRQQSSRKNGGANSRTTKPSNDNLFVVSRPGEHKYEPQTWRVYGVEVHPDDLVLDCSSEVRIQVKDTEQSYLKPAVLKALFNRLKIRKGIEGTSSNSTIDLPPEIAQVRVVRRSMDARHKKVRSDGRTGPRFVYVLDVDITSKAASATLKLRPAPGRMELVPSRVAKKNDFDSVSASDLNLKEKRVVIVGAGPAGLFCALKLARAGVKTIVMERGQPVEARGKDIGALMHRRRLNSESNFAFGEGGAGTWSDGKLTTRIGRNSDAVRFVLETLVEYGAPANILFEGAPHLGTDNLVRLLRMMRQDLRRLGGEVWFTTHVNRLIIQEGVARGVEFSRGPVVERTKGDKSSYAGHEDGRIFADAVVLATGHSARDVYYMLHEQGVILEPKGFAVGFRVEHPQKLINKIQFGTEWGPAVVTGKLTTDFANKEYFESVNSREENERHTGTLPVPSYRLATDDASDGSRYRGVYSFCMCPGGQIVPSSTDPEEICVNGMSFSRRDSQWANSALVVTVSPDDKILDDYRQNHGVLAGLAFQREMERKAAILGGGNLTVPVQRLTDFLCGRASNSAPPSSYRLGVKPAACHEIYPEPIVASLRAALTEQFEKQMPGFICEDGLLHAVETRTSSPVRVSRDERTMQAVGTKMLFPSGEGAGFAGGIVSAGVDGMTVADSVLEAFGVRTQTLGTTGSESSSKSVRVLPAENNF